MMRNGRAFGLAARVRGEVVAERRGWYSFLPETVRNRPFVRGFPVLVETLVNGIKSLNRSAELQGAADDRPMEGWHLVATLVVSLAFAVVLFLLIPHGLSWLMGVAGLGGGVEGVSFQLWDGLFKMLMLVGYIAVIGRIPEIRRVFQYHGAEHMTIHAFETGLPVDAALAAAQSRLHPRCGTTFLLFVICIAVLLQAILVPLFLYLWTPDNAVLKHGVTLVFKLALMVPISALSYELIRFSGCMKESLWARVLRAPGLALQLLTTRVPDTEQLEVAVVALKEALGPDSPYEVRTCPYSRL